MIDGAQVTPPDSNSPSSIAWKDFEVTRGRKRRKKKKEHVCNEYWKITFPSLTLRFAMHYTYYHIASLFIAMIREWCSTCEVLTPAWASSGGAAVGGWFQPLLPYLVSIYLRPSSSSPHTPLSLSLSFSLTISSSDLPKPEGIRGICRRTAAVRMNVCVCVVFLAALWTLLVVASSLC